MSLLVEKGRGGGGALKRGNGSSRKIACFYWPDSWSNNAGSFLENMQATLRPTMGRYVTIICVLKG